jgi:hypothetical protein
MSSKVSKGGIFNKTAKNKAAENRTRRGCHLI